MADPFMAEIRLFGGTFGPLGWATCDGQTMAISQNEAVFQLIGTTYGGDGQTTFNLPDLRGRIPVHFGLGSGLSDYNLGQVGGSETITLTSANMAPHRHDLFATTTAAESRLPTSNIPASSVRAVYAASGPSNTPMEADAISMAPGGSLPHENVMPFLCVNFIFCLEGIFPSQG